MTLKNITAKELAARVRQKLQEHNLEAVLVGGACVTIYSDDRYVSYDLDYVTYDDMRKIKEALKELGFHQENRYFQHKDCPFFIEFVAPPVAIGEEQVDSFELLEDPLGEIKLLTPTDCVKDRLAAYYHWDDLQGLEQALLVCRDQKVDLNNVKKWSKKEGFLDKFKKFESSLKKS